MSCLLVTSSYFFLPFVSQLCCVFNLSKALKARESQGELPCVGA